jgi:type I restriction enzyme S subunit
MSFPRYPKYKDSGVGAPAVIPDHWQATCVKRFSTLQRGHDLTDSERTDGIYPVVTSGGINGTHGAFVAKGPGVVTGRYGSTGRLFYIDDNFWPHNTSLYVCNFHGNLPRFVWYALHNIDFATHSAKTAVPGIDRNDIHVLWAVAPPPKEQVLIADFLDRETAKIDALIAEQQRLIELLQEKRQAVISHAVTKGLNPDAPTKDSGIEWLGEVPEHWEVRRIGVLFREVNEQGKDDLPILSVSIHDGVSDKEMAEEELDRKVTRSDDRTKYKRVAAGDLVYNMMRAWQGGFGTVAVEGMVSPAYVVARPRSEIVTSYVEHVLRTPAAVEQMRRHSRGITDFRLRLYWDEFKNISVPVPPFAEVKEICAAICGIAEQAEALEAEAHRAITLLQERRSALISAAVTGQIDVRGFAGAEAI